MNRMVVLVTGVLCLAIPNTFFAQDIPNQQRLELLEQQAIDAGYGLIRVNALRELHQLGAEIVIRHGEMSISLPQGNEVHQPQTDGSNKISKRPCWTGNAEDLDLVDILEPDKIEIMNSEFGSVELARLFRCQGLRKIRLVAIAPSTDPSIFGYLVRLRELTEFAINFNLADDQLLEALAQLPKLESINVGYGKLTANGIQVLQKLPRLASVSLSNCLINDAILVEVCSLPNLQCLALSGVEGLSANGFRALARSSIRSYSISGKQVPNRQGTVQFAITDGAIEELSKMRGVQGISLWRSQLDDDQFVELLKSWEGDPMPGNSSGKTLYLQDTRITDKSVDAILASPQVSFPKAFVVLPDTVSGEAAEKLKAAHPQWNVVYYERVGGRNVSRAAGGR